MNTTSFTRILTAVGVLIALSAQAQAASSHIVKRGSAPIAKVKTTGKPGGGTAQAQVDDSDLTCNSNVGIMQDFPMLDSVPSTTGTLAVFSQQTLFWRIVRRDIKPHIVEMRRQPS